MNPINTFLQAWEGLHYGKPIDPLGGDPMGIVDNRLSGSNNDVLIDPRDNLAGEQLPLVTAVYR